MLYHELEDGLYTAGPYFFAKVRAEGKGCGAGRGADAARKGSVENTRPCILCGCRYRIL